MRLAVAGGSGSSTEKQAVGRCARCGVECVGPRAERKKLVRLLRAHEVICPGGSRGGEVWAPLDGLLGDAFDE